MRQPYQQRDFLSSTAVCACAIPYAAARCLGGMEAAHERQVRLERRRLQHRARRSTETAEAREARLQRQRTGAQQRRAMETEEQRETRLSRAREYRHRRILLEIPEEQRETVDFANFDLLDSSD